MAKIHIKRQHHLGQEVAKERVEEVAKKLQDKLNAKWAWQGNSLRFERTGASGRVDVDNDHVEFNIKLSLVLAPMKGKIESAIQDQLNKALS
jgi:putative polyhydroxyalkanoate system protein